MNCHRPTDGYCDSLTELAKWADPVKTKKRHAGVHSFKKPHNKKRSSIKTFYYFLKALKKLILVNHVQSHCILRDTTRLDIVLYVLNLLQIMISVILKIEISQHVYMFNNIVDWIMNLISTKSIPSVKASKYESFVKC